MNTVEKNKMIAEFMGLSYNMVFHAETEHVLTIPISFYSNLNKLFEVFDKIKELGYWIIIDWCSHKSVEIGKIGSLDSICFSNEENKTIAIFNAVVEFITWFNENKK